LPIPMKAISFEVSCIALVQRRRLTPPCRRGRIHRPQCSARRCDQADSDAYYVLYRINMSDRVFVWDPAVLFRMEGGQPADQPGPPFCPTRPGDGGLLFGGESLTCSTLSFKHARNQNASQKRKRPSICGALCERVHRAVHRRVLPVLHLHPMLRSTSLIVPVPALRHPSLQALIGTTCLLGQAAGRISVSVWFTAVGSPMIRPNSAAMPSSTARFSFIRLE
jgi:hypothetical protein